MWLWMPGSSGPTATTGWSPWFSSAVCRVLARHWPGSSWMPIQTSAAEKRLESFPACFRCDPNGSSPTRRKWGWKKPELPWRYINRSPNFSLELDALTWLPDDIWQVGCVDRRVPMAGNSFRGQQSIHKNTLLKGDAVFHLGVTLCKTYSMTSTSLLLTGNLLWRPVWRIITFARYRALNM